MSLTFKQFGSIEEMELFLRGGISGGKQIASSSGVVLGLHGKTLIFAAPVGTVTFSDPSGDGLTLSEIAQQIAAVVTVASQFRGGSLSLVQPTPTTGVSLSKSGTANKFFGFSGATDSVGTVVNGPSGAVPRLLQTLPKAQNDGFYAVLEN